MKNSFERPPSQENPAEFTCPDCNGTKKYNGKECKLCNGTGKVRDKER